MDIMKKFKKVLSVALAMALVCSSSMVASAKTKTWSLYHYKGAPSTEGLFSKTCKMEAGGTVVEVKMESYSNIDKTVIAAYRKAHPDQKQFLTASYRTANLYAEPTKVANIVVSMSTTEYETTRASGSVTR